MGVRSLVSIVLKPMIPSCFGSSYVQSLLIKSGNLKGFDKHPEQLYNPSWNPKVIRTQLRPRQPSGCLNVMTLACLLLGEKMGNLASPFKKLLMLVAKALCISWSISSLLHLLSSETSPTLFSPWISVAWCKYSCMSCWNMKMFTKIWHLFEISRPKKALLQLHEETSIEKTHREIQRFWTTSIELLRCR
jgi:hypothetical protein